MNNLSKENSTKVRDTLNDFIVNTRGITDDEELQKLATDSFAKNLSHSPALMRRAAETYNSSKAIHKLSTSNDDTRGADFALLNPEKIYQEGLQGRKAMLISKAANVGMSLTVCDEDADFKAIEKVASDDIPLNYHDEVVRPRMDHITLVAEIDKLGKNITKIAGARNIAEIRAERAVDEFSNIFYFMPKEARDDLADKMVKLHGDQAVALLDSFNYSYPMNKVATGTTYIGTPSKPDTASYKAACEVFKQLDKWDRYDTLTKQASYDALQVLQDVPLTIRRFRNKSLNKEAASSDLLNGVLLGGTVQKIAPAAMGVNTDTKADLYDKLNTASLQNKNRELQTVNTFYNIIGDEFISSYPINDIVNAYNRALQNLPVGEVQRPAANVQLLRSWVAEDLSRGGTPSASDAQKVLDTAKALGKSPKEENPFKDNGGRA